MFSGVLPSLICLDPSCSGVISPVFMGGGVKSRQRWWAYFTDFAIKWSARKYATLGRGLRLLGLGLGGRVHDYLLDLIANWPVNSGWTGCAPERDTHGGDTHRHTITHRFVDSSCGNVKEGMYANWGIIGWNDTSNNAWMAQCCTLDGNILYMSIL